MTTSAHARLETRQGQSLALLGLSVQGELRGLMFTATVTQQFRNPGNTHLEVVYTFPLPWGAVLMGVEVVLGQQRLQGIVTGKQQAEARYEAALSEGHAALMLEHNHDQTYTLNLGNLAPDEHCSISLRYAHTLPFEQRGLRLMIPTVIAPRYGDPQRQGKLAPHQVPQHSWQADYPFDLKLQLHGAVAQARVASPSHRIAMRHQHDADRGAVLTVSLAQQAALDRDFVLVLDELAHDSVAVAAPDHLNREQVAVLASFCPRISKSSAAGAAVKILVDCSGSMAGDSIEAARRALTAIVQQLGAGDAFALSRFGSTVVHRSRGLWQATAVTQQAAQRWIDALQADMGGTEMEAALASTFALAQADSSDVLLVTDGDISAIDDTIATARASGHRVFVVGIGSSPAEAHLRRLAQATGGACDFVAPGEAVEPAVLRMFARLHTPRLTRLSLTWPQGVTPLWVSPLLPSVFDGDTVNVFALLPHATSGEVCLLGCATKDEAPLTLGHARLEGPETHPNTSPDTSLSRLMAWSRYHASPDAADDVPAATERAALAVNYQLVTADTHFILVHQRAEHERATDMPELHQVAQMMPAGWGGQSSVLVDDMDSTNFGDTGGLLCEPDHDAFDYALPAASAMPAPPPQVAAPAPSKRAYRTRAIQPSQPASAWNPADLPAFLRRQVEPYPHGPTVDKRDARYWLDSAHYVGWTPLGLSEWLRLTPPDQWPTSYAQLQDMGLGVWIVDWLELFISKGHPHSERDVVHAFLHLLAQQPKVGEDWAALGASLPPSSPVDAPLLQAIATGLAGMTATEWPPQVFALNG